LIGSDRAGRSSVHGCSWPHQQNRDMVTGRGSVMSETRESSKSRGTRRPGLASTRHDITAGSVMRDRMSSRTTVPSPHACCEMRRKTTVSWDSSAESPGNHANPLPALPILFIARRNLARQRRWACDSRWRFFDAYATEAAHPGSIDWRAIVPKNEPSER
jgi:hypothetical protein